MEEVFSYIIGLGAAVMMPIIFTILGVCIGIKLSKALKSGLLVGVGFVGLSVVTALLTSSLGPALSKVVEIYGLQLKVFDMGWPYRIPLIEGRIFRQLYLKRVRGCWSTRL